MSLLAYVNGLAAQGVELWASGGKLQYRAPKELITLEFLGQLKQRKAELIELLQEFAASTGTYPLSYSQKSLWSLHQLNPHSAAYNVMFAAQMVDDLQIETLQRCFDYLIARHPILRTRYSVVDGQPQQKVETTASTGIDIREAAGLGDPQIHAWIDEEANKPFDLAVAPIRLKLLVCKPSVESSEASAARCILLINVHHIAADFWSLEIFIRELSLLYRMALNGQALRLPPIELQYKDCVRRESERLQGPEGEALAAFWEGELGGELPVLNFLTDFCRPPVKTENGRVFTLDLGEPLTAAVKAAARANQVTPYMLLLGVYQLFLFLHSGQRRMLIGAPTAGRDLQGSESILGHFVNTVVLPCHLDARSRFADLLVNTRSMMLRVMEHQAYPFPLLVERLRPERDPSRSPLFQVMYNWNQAHMESREQLEGAEFSLIRNMLAASSTGTRGATHDLTLNIYDYGQRYVTAWTFNTDLFQQTTIERFAQQYRGLLQQVLTDPTKPLVRYSLVDEKKRAEILQRALAKRHGEARPTPIAADFVRLARERPDAIALRAKGVHRSYGDALHAFSALRSRLAELGVRAGSAVAIEVQEPAERALVALALLDMKADVHLPGNAEAAGQSATNTADLVVTGSPSGEGWAPERIQIERSNGRALPWLSRCLSSAQLEAYIRGIENALDVSADSQVLSLHGTDDDLALATCLSTWACGGTVHRPDHLDVPAIVNGGSLGEYARRWAISTLVVPSPLALYAAREDLDALRTLVLVGDSSSPPAKGCAEGRTVRLLPRFALDSLCPTISFEWRGRQWVMNETGVDTAAAVLGELDDVVDDDRCGRLCLLTDRGTRPNAVVTMDGFDWVGEPPAEVAGHDLLKTPCAVTRTNSGSIVYRGLTTRDATHRIAPFRVDLVEERIAEQGGVEQAVCAVREIDAQPALIAYVHWKDANSGSGQSCEEQLRKRLKQRLPDYMHPNSWVILAAMPLTRAGFIDESRLPVPEAGAARKHVAPRNEIEEKLAAIWKEALALKEVGVYDNFFELGGDSILGAVMISKASARGLYFSPKDIFENTSIAELASVVRTAPEVQVDQGPATGRMAVAPAQSWFFDRVRTDRSHFNQALLVELREEPDPIALEQALQLLVRQHDVLRSRFSVEGGEWFQIFDAESDATGAPRLTVVRCDQTRVPCEEAILAAQRSLDIERGQLFKAVWLDCGCAEDSRLLLVVHHLAIDGLSWSILLEDLDRAYSQLRAKGAVQLPLKTTSYRDWASNLQTYAAGESLAKDTAYWEEFSKAVIATNSGSSADWLIAPQSDRESNDGTVQTRTVALEREPTTAFCGKAHRAYNTDANDLLLAALYASFTARSDGRRLLIDVEGHGREPLDGIDISRTVGWFTAIYPVVFDFDRSPDRAALIKGVKQRLRDVPHRGLGYGIFRYRKDAGSCDFPQLPRSPILFTYLGQLDQLAGGSDLFAGRIEPAPGIRSARQSPTHPLDVCAYITGGRLTIQCTFDSALFVAAEIDAVLARTQRELNALIEHCLEPAAGGMTPSDLPELGIDQQQLDALLSEVALLDE